MLRREYRHSGRYSKPAGKHTCRITSGRHKRDWIDNIGFLRSAVTRRRLESRDTVHPAYGRWEKYRGAVGFSKRQGNPKVWKLRELRPKGWRKIKTRGKRFEFVLSSVLTVFGRGLRS